MIHHTGHVHFLNGNQEMVLLIYKELTIKDVVFIDSNTVQNGQSPNFNIQMYIQIRMIINRV